MRAEVDSGRSPAEALRAGPRLRAVEGRPTVWGSIAWGSVAWGVCLVACMAMGCRHGRATDAPEGDAKGDPRGGAPAAPELTVSTDAMGRPFMVRQRVAVDYRGRSESFEAVVQFDGTTLTILGLTPFGSRAFVLHQRGLELELESTPGIELPFDPRWLVADVHAVFFVRDSDATRTLVYEGEAGDDPLPPRVTVDNLDFGYRLTIENVEQRWLPDPSN